jgi:predicted ATP-grasp superfamily ATP-dependent carboligase
MEKVKSIMIIALAGLACYLFLTRPDPPAPLQVIEKEKKIEDLQNRFDSLARENRRLREKWKSDSARSSRLIKEKDVRSLPAAELDSIVRVMYGADAVPAD